MLGSLAEGVTRVSGFLEGEDSLATLRAFRDMGVRIEGPDAGRVVIHGVGMHGLKAPSAALDLGNSGTSMRLMTGLLAGQGMEVTLVGDASLTRRPMKRVTDPLAQMGARIDSASGGTAPLQVHAVASLRGIDYPLPVASAQVKSCLLLAGMYADGETCISEPAPTRDHTERMLQGFGYPVSASAGRVCLRGGGRLQACDIDVPADISSAAFFLVGASIAPGSDLVLEHVGVNPTRDGVINILRQMGADIEVLNRREIGGEPVADLRVRSAPLRGIRIPQDQVPLAIDEFPVLFVAAACAEGETVLTGAEELRVKESDRIQVMADEHGTVWAIGERECSIQRRHQKIIEEAPSPLVERVTGMRERLFQAARLAAGAIGYAGAGTVEFLADDEGRFYFLEMNTRLQVEHPVTELTTGLDLVELQLLVADGERLGAQPPAGHGHAIEARIYAEDPARNWQPQAGRVHRFEVPGAARQFGLFHGTGVRLDSGIVGAATVSIHYDPMLAKVISHAPTRGRAAQVLAGALAGAELHGVRTNRDLLVNVLRHHAFLAGATDTAFFDTHGLDALARPLADDRAVRLSAIAAALTEAAHNRAIATVQAEIPSGWRNLASGDQHKSYQDAGGEEHRVAYRFTRAGVVLPGNDGVTVVAAEPGEAVLADAGGVATLFTVSRYGADVFVDSPLGSVALTAVPRYPEPGTVVEKGSLLAPMPGAVIRLGAALGDTVSAGQPLIWLEAMKMEHTIAAPSDGVLTQLDVHVGQQVEVGTVLARVEDPAPPEASPEGES